MIRTKIWTRRAAVFATGLIFSQLANAQEAAERVSAASLTEEQRSRAVGFLCSSDQNLRSGTYAACRRLGDEGKEIYREILKKGEAYHRANLDAAVDRVRKHGASFDRALENMIASRAVTLEFLRTDHQKNPAKIAQLDRAYADLEQLVVEVEDELKRASPRDLIEPIGALGEIWVELAWCDGKDLSLRDVVVANETKVVPKDLQSRVLGMRSLENKILQLERVNTFNSQLKWPDPAQKSFAGIVNRSRFVMGLDPLSLDERLSEAAKGHSQEMKKLNYFSHTSPVAGNQSPGLRARNAEFEGSFRGENIFYKSNGAVPSEAYRAWWESDGHRIIMFGDNQNTLGLGISSGTTHWTMMTGNKRS